MNENEKKVYSIIGQVTIGTDEYRDLIEAVQEARIKESEQSRRWYEEYQKANRLDNELKTANEQLAKFKEYLESHAEARANYRLWVAGIEEGEQ